MSRRVLVVEDDVDIGRLVSLQLTELGCECRVVDDGVSGLAEAKAGRYDLVILDLTFPAGEDGVSLARGLRAVGSRVRRRRAPVSRIVRPKLP